MLGGEGRMRDDCASGHFIVNDYSPRASTSCFRFLLSDFKTHWLCALNIVFMATPHLFLSTQLKIWSTSLRTKLWTTSRRLSDMFSNNTRPLMRQKSSHLVDLIPEISVPGSVKSISFPPPSLSCKISKAHWRCIGLLSSCSCSAWFPWVSGDSVSVFHRILSSLHSSIHSLADNGLEILRPDDPGRYRGNSGLQKSAREASGHDILYDWRCPDSTEPL